MAAEEFATTSPEFVHHPQNPTNLAKPAKVYTAVRDSGPVFERLPNGKPQRSWPGLPSASAELGVDRAVLEGAIRRGEMLGGRLYTHAAFEEAPCTSATSSESPITESASTSLPSSPVALPPGSGAGIGAELVAMEMQPPGTAPSPPLEPQSTPLGLDPRKDLRTYERCGKTVSWKNYRRHVAARNSGKETKMGRRSVDRAVRCVDTGKTYPSIKAAAEAVGYPIGYALAPSAKNPGRCHGQQWEYVDGPLSAVAKAAAGSPAPRGRRVKPSAALVAEIALDDSIPGVVRKLQAKIAKLEEAVRLLEGLGDW